ncbi:MAG: NTP transferase domain-containing protein, partial [Armatimonadota bacterium]
MGGAEQAKAPGARALGVAILAGGKGQRLRPDKGCLLVAGTPIVTRVVAAARSVTDQLLIVGSAPLPAGLTVPVVPDEGGGSG